jgi:hypothetical protein
MAPKLPPARQYVHAASAGDMAACVAEIDDLDKTLLRAYDQGTIMGFNLAAIQSDEEGGTESIDLEWTKIIPKVYPIVYAFIQQPNERPFPESLEQYLLSVGYRRVR